MEGKIPYNRNMLKCIPFLLLLACVCGCGNTGSGRSGGPASAIDTVQPSSPPADSLASLNSVITCPRCGHTATERMPTDICLLKYTCKKCGAVLTPEGEDCCVYCTYGSVKCPSMQ
jgi:hypothetical protein